MASQLNRFLCGCGASQYGQLLCSEVRTEPVIINREEFFFKDNDIIMVQAGRWSTAVLLKGDKVFLYGNIINIEGLCDKNLLINPESGGTEFFNISKIAIGDEHLILLGNNGQILAFGNVANSYREHIMGKIVNVFAKFDKSAFVMENNRVLITNYAKGNITIEFSSQVKDVALTASSFGVLSQDALYIFDDEGQMMFEIENIVSVAASENIFIILKNNSAVFELLESGKTRQIHGIDGVAIKVFAGSNHYGVITLDGECWMWGCGLFGQLGSGKKEYASIPEKTKIKVGYRVIDVHAGECHSIFLITKDNTFSHKIPEEMKTSDYIKVVNTTFLVSGSLIASQYDYKF